MTFKALLTTKTGEAISTQLVDFNDEDLMPGDVTVAIEFSTVNYKDAMALSGRSPVIRQFPLIPGIDFAGIVETSSHCLLYTSPSPRDGLLSRMPSSA